MIPHAVPLRAYRRRRLVREALAIAGNAVALGLLLVTVYVALWVVGGGLGRPA